MLDPSSPGVDRGDPLARVLEIGLAFIVVGAPMLIGAVQPATRLTVEIAALVLGAIWLVRSLGWATPLPPRVTLIGIAGLLILAILQIAPMGNAVASRISPEGARIREASVPGSAALENEHQLIGRNPMGLEARPTLSVDPRATASALRTGAALAVLVVVATTVAATRGVVFLAVALALSAAFQALYGILMLVSDQPMLWHIPKRYYLTSATGTFVNRNHFAGYLAAALPSTLALVIWLTRRRKIDPAHRFGPLSTTEGSRALLVGLLLALGLAGLLLSLSRAGIAVGLFALVVTAAGAGRRGLTKRLAMVILVIGVASIPLIQLGADRLAERYAQTSEHLTDASGRPTVWKDTLEMATRFPVAGTGFGTFAGVYPLYRSPTVRKFYDHAHNDAAQALAEGGLVGAILLLMILAPLMAGIVRLITDPSRPLAVGIGAGLSALLLHGLVDFNFHIPSNAALAAVLAGAVFGLIWKPRD